MHSEKGASHLMREAISMHSEKGQATFELGSGQRGCATEEAGSCRRRASEEAGWGGLLHPSTCRTQVVTAFGAVEVVAAVQHNTPLHEAPLFAHVTTHGRAIWVRRRPCTFFLSRHSVALFARRLTTPSSWYREGVDNWRREKAGSWRRCASEKEAGSWRVRASEEAASSSRRASEEAGSWRGRASEKEAGSWRGRASEEAGSSSRRASEEAGKGRWRLKAAEWRECGTHGGRHVLV